MDIEIPSPSVFLRRSPSPPAVSLEATPERHKRPRNKSSTQEAGNNRPNVERKNTQDRGIAKPKQTKSRNGCITCKKKRLKCDETMPTCVQCQKRRVECEGYKTEYKWRTFEELEKSKSSRTGNVGGVKISRPQVARKDPAATQPEAAKKSDQQAPIASKQDSKQAPLDPRGIEKPTSPAAKDVVPIGSSSQADTPTSIGGVSLMEPLPSLKLGFGLESVYNELEPHGSLEQGNSFDEALALEYEDNEDYIHDDDHQNYPPFFTNDLDPSVPAPADGGDDLWLDDADFEMAMDVSRENDFTDDRPELEMEGQENDNRLALNQPPSRNPGGIVVRHRQSRSIPSSRGPSSPGLMFFKTPAFDLSSPEMLMLRFDRETCGVLSIKDGMFENPWRTLIWPLAKDSEPLYHAIMAMSALHGAGAGAQPQLRLTGVAHMTKSISTLSDDIGHISVEQALATTLALALAEAWDDKITTGIHHLKGARFLLERALEQRSRGAEPNSDGRPLRFLANTYIYLEAIGRLTSQNQPDHHDLEYLLRATAEPLGTDFEVDPLLGCGASLFPLLAQVARLVHSIRGSRENSLNAISEANELKEQLLNWHPTDVNLFVQPEDPTSNVRHALQTAEAYRRAILLHLDQAIPELANESSYDQAKGILMILATVPLSSRTLVIQIFPLLVGSCEMVTDEDRQWAMRRWQAMMQRLTLINVSACWRVVEEVWRRRDARARMSPKTAAARDASSNLVSETVNTALSRQRQFQPPRRGTESSPLRAQLECTVRGQLHWLGVMSDWAWEVFL